MFYFSEKYRGSLYSNLYRVNMIIDELFLAANHGSALGYRYDLAGNAVVEEEWDDDEHMLYDHYIEDIQHRLLHLFSLLCVKQYDKIDDTILTKYIGSMIWKSAMFPTKKRLVLMKNLNEGFIQNFQQEEKKTKYRVADAKVNYKVLFFDQVDMHITTRRSRSIYIKRDCSVYHIQYDG